MLEKTQTKQTSHSHKFWNVMADNVHLLRFNIANGYTFYLKLWNFYNTVCSNDFLTPRDNSRVIANDFENGPGKHSKNSSTIKNQIHSNGTFGAGNLDFSYYDWDTER